MKVAVYVVAQGGQWQARISLNLAVDELWWAGEAEGLGGWGGRWVVGGGQVANGESQAAERKGQRADQRSQTADRKGQRVARESQAADRKGQRVDQRSQPADRVVVLSRSLPLGWAVKLAAACKFTDQMQRWDESAWRKYAAALLKAEIRAEQAAGGGREAGWPFEEIQVYKLPEDRGWSEDEGRVVGGWNGGRKAGVSEWRDREGFEWGDEPGSEWESGRDSGGEKEWENERVIERGSRRESWRGNEQVNLRGHELEVLAAGANRLVTALDGRSLLQGEAEALVAEQLPELAENWRATAQLAYLQGRLRLEAAVQGTGAARLGLRRREVPRCLRCGSVPTGRTACAACGLAGCAYCEACLALGRSRACALLLRSAPLPAVRCTAGVSPTVAARRWGLSAAQAAAAAAALGFLAEPRRRSAARGPERFLLWAVTGAGKTEMVFPLLEAALAAGGRALIATPRRDVVLELAPRLARAFPADVPAVLYGGSEDRLRRSRITLATTHQLLRFHQAFDLVIIDEIDAFPYHNDPMLDYAARQVCKPGGRFILLSATPPAELQRLARSGRLPHARVPVRFHGHPLPVPRHIRMPPLYRCLKQGRIPAGLRSALQRSLDRKAQIFLFVSRIVHIEGLLQLLRRMFPEISIEGTSSQDPGRAEKVLKFRDGTISLLVTTTILERGVTVPHSDVFILDADSGLFDEAALVQMAGRAGRSKDDPAGNVIFASTEWSRSQRAAISQIRSMNAIARRQGYLKS
ncbi:helicase-related protein [Paenibacillus sp. FSL P2-0136]|uniref:helicase-related protein n=1 Tax=Paenibacillus sp. FSL P2-0136 TaxID=2975317 RepID=UPI0030D74F05